jgi:hypothetical protein
MMLMGQHSTSVKPGAMLAHQLTEFDTLSLHKLHLNDRAISEKIPAVRHEKCLQTKTTVHVIYQGERVK